MHSGSSIIWIKLALQFAQMTPLLTSTFFPREHEFKAAEKHQITLGTLDLCMTACYKENDCTFVKYEEARGVCTIYIDGTDVQPPSDTVYEINRNLTDPSCECKIPTPTEVTFKSIEAKPTDSSKSCNGIPDAVTAVYVYFKGDLRLYSTDPSELIRGEPVLKLILTSYPEPQCTAVPVFIRADHRRLFFGSVYNTTGYEFLNAYAYAERCVCSSGQCCGALQIKEYVSNGGNYLYKDYAQLPRSDVQQTFFIAHQELAAYTQ